MEALHALSTAGHACWHHTQWEPRTRSELPPMLLAHRPAGPLLVYTALQYTLTYSDNLVDGMSMRVSLSFTAGGSTLSYPLLQARAKTPPLSFTAAPPALYYILLYSRGRSPPPPFGFQTVICLGVPGYALYPSAQVPMPAEMTVWKQEMWGATAATLTWTQLAVACPSAARKREAPMLMAAPSPWQLRSACGRRAPTLRNVLV